MEIGTFFLGAIFGMVIILFIDWLEYRKSKDNDCVRYFDESVSYENKKETSFEVYDVLGNAAIATEISLNYGRHKKYNGKFVLIRGEDFYDGQIINVKNPKRVGTYRYMLNTVPIIEGEMK